MDRWCREWCGVGECGVVGMMACCVECVEGDDAARGRGVAESCSGLCVVTRVCLSVEYGKDVW